MHDWGHLLLNSHFLWVLCYHKLVLMRHRIFFNSRLVLKGFRLIDSWLDLLDFNTGFILKRFLFILLIYVNTYGPTNYYSATTSANRNSHFQKYSQISWCLFLITQAFTIFVMSNRWWILCAVSPSSANYIILTITINECIVPVNWCVSFSDNSSVI